MPCVVVWVMCVVVCCSFAHASLCVCGMGDDEIEDWVRDENELGGMESLSGRVDAGVGQNQPPPSTQGPFLAPSYSCVFL